ncbi:MAG: HIRAN domain-containing protein [Lachnospiraceae bacterium]|nr:HIRAN domain-containing protein [Lachnospiraceae bacterium]MBP3543946.1 HIRAN domain-containing protein [Lachnospiraceae bacterium]
MKEVHKVKQITKVRKSVCAMANQLRKAGYSLKDAFKKAWQRVKLSMTVWAAGTTFENRQERLQFLQQFKLEDLTVTLEREKENKFDCNAIQIVVHIKPISKRTIIGYIPKGLARELSKVIDMGIQVKATLMQIIGGYGWKESLGALINIAI